MASSLAAPVTGKRPGRGQLEIRLADASQVSRYLTSQTLLSPLVILPSFVWALLLHFLDIQNAPPGAGFLIRFGILVLLHAVMFGFPWAAKVLVLPRLRADQRPAALAIALALGSILRGLLLGGSLAALGYLADAEYLFRALASFTNMTISVGLLWIGSSLVRGYFDARRRLLRERDQLIALQLEADQRLHGFDEQAAERIRESVLDSIRATSDTDVDEAISQLRVSIDDVVRPLSHFLSAQGRDWVAPPQPPERPYRIDWLRVIRDSVDPAKFRPVLTSIGLLWISAANTVLNHGWGAGLLSAVFCFGVFAPLLGFAKFIESRYQTRLGQPAKALLFIVFAVLAGAAAGLASTVYLADSQVPLQYLYLAPWFTVIFAMMIGVADTSIAQAAAVQGELEASTKDLRWALTRTRELHRQHQRALAHTLHGRIQATLASAVLRLEKLQNAGEATPARLRDLRNEMLETVGSLDFHSAEPEPLGVMLERVRSNWEGAARIHLQVEPVLALLLQRDPVCLTTINDLVPELVFNSVKHGNAAEITVSLVRFEEAVLLLEVVDNGKTPLQAGRRGLGSQLLDDCAITWSRKRIAGETSTSALLPFRQVIG